MGSGLIIYVLMPFYITFVIVLRRWSRERNPKIFKKANKYVNEFFFNGIIISIEEMYIIVLICIFVNYHQIMQEGFIWDINTVALILNSIVCVLYPILIVALFFVKTDTLLEDEIADRIGVLYEDLDLEKKGKLVFVHVLASVARRIIFGVVLVFMTDYPLF